VLLSDKHSRLFILIIAVAYSHFAKAEVREVTLLFTNDFESAFDPTPAYWRDDIDLIGGAAQIATLVDFIRAKEDLDSSLWR
jgi:5'-nucleotidase / UDP-sugar diphosphatase